MSDSGSGSFFAVVLFWVVVGGVGYAAYKHLHPLEVHSKTNVVVEFKDVGFERVYGEDGHLESNKVNAGVNIPLGAVNVKRKLEVEEIQPRENTMPFTNRDRVHFNASTIFSTNSEPFRYARKYDPNGALIGQELSTDLGGYARAYDPAGRLKSETLSAGLNMQVGPVDLQCRRIWTFTKPVPKKIELPRFDYWKGRIVTDTAPSIRFAQIDPNLLKTLPSKSVGR